MVILNKKKNTFMGKRFFFFLWLQNIDHYASHNPTYGHLFAHFLLVATLLSENTNNL